jgi:hypothetical protein
LTGVDRAVNGFACVEGEPHARFAIVAVLPAPTPSDRFRPYGFRAYAQPLTGLCIREPSVAFVIHSPHAC